MISTETPRTEQSTAWRLNQSNLAHVTIDPDLSIADAIARLDASHVTAALVVDAFGEVAGLVTRSLLRRELLNGKGLHRRVEDVALPAPARAAAGEPMPEASGDGTGDGAGDGAGDGLGDSAGDRTNGANVVFHIDRDGRPLNVFHVPANARVPRERPQRRPGGRRIAILGGAGYIGSVLARRLLTAGHQVSILDNFFYGDASIAALRRHPNCRIVRGDTRHLDALSSVVRDADAVVHLAELVGDPLCARDPNQTLEINFLATQNVAHVVAAHGVKRFVYVSSCSVYGASSDPDVILHEDSPQAPVSLYAEMKIRAEQSILGIRDAAFTPTILRLGTVFGLSPRPRFDLVVNTLTAKAIRQGVIPIFGGDQWRPHVHVTDVARSIEHVLAAPRERVRREVFNVVGENRKIMEVGSIIADLIPDAALQIENVVTDRRNYRVTGEKAHRMLGFAPRKRIQDGANEIAEALLSGRIRNHEDRAFNNALAFQAAA